MTALTRSPRRALPLIMAIGFVCLASSGVAYAATCTVGKTKPLVVLTRSNDKYFPESLAKLLSDAIHIRLIDAAPDVAFMAMWDGEPLATLVAVQQGVGSNDGYADALVDAMGAEFAMHIRFEKPNDNKLTTVLVILQSGHTGEQIRRVFKTAPADNAAAFLPLLPDIVRTMSADLYCELTTLRIRPIRPNLSAVAASPSTVGPAGTVSVSVRLTDADNGLPQTGYSVDFLVLALTNVAIGTPVGALTDVDGVARQQITMPRAPGTYRIQARFVRSDNTEAPRTAASVRVSKVLGDLQIFAPQVALLVGQGERVTARLQRNLTVGAGEIVDFVASGGTLSASSATTDATGEASVTYQTPPTNAIVDVTATAPATPPSPTPLRVQTLAAPGDAQADEPPLTATVTLVVDGQVSMAINAPDTVEGGATDITVDIAVGGNPAASIPVTFTLTGPGRLSATSGSTDAAGRLQIAYAAPTSTASITVMASAIVDGQTYTKTVTFAVASASPSVFTLQYISATNCTDGTGLVELRFTPYPGGTVPPPSLPYTLSHSACGGHVDLTVQRASDNGVELDADLDEAANQYASGAAVVAATFTRDGVLEIDLNPAWATSTPDPVPGQYGLYGDVVIQDASFKILGRFTYDFTNQRVVRSDAPAILAAGSYYIVMQYGGSNNAANVGRGRLVTVRIR
jgi:hypothetical protein